MSETTNNGGVEAAVSAANGGAAVATASPAPDREKLTKKAITADLFFLSLARERTEVRVNIL